MNEQYLRGLHGHLNIKDDYDTWVGSVSGNEQYLRGLHGHLGIKDEYETWYSSVWGEEQVKKKEEFEPASTEAFLAYTPTSAVSDTDLGLSTDKSPEDPSRFLTQPEQEQVKSIDEYKSAPQRRFIDPVTGGEQAVARIPMLAEMESEEVVALQRDKDAEQERKQAEEFREQAERNYKLNPLNNLVINAVDATFENVRNTIASKVSTRKDLLSSSQVDMEAYDLSLMVEESNQQQAREKSSQKALLGVDKGNLDKGFSQNIDEGNVKDAFLSLFVDGVYGIADAPRTAAAFLAGRASGGIITGLNVFSTEYADVLASNPLMSKQERVLYV